MNLQLQPPCLHSRIGCRERTRFFDRANAKNEDAAQCTVVAKWSGDYQLLHFGEPADVCQMRFLNGLGFGSFIGSPFASTYEKREIGDHRSARLRVLFENVFRPPGMQFGSEESRSYDGISGNPCPGVVC